MKEKYLKYLCQAQIFLNNKTFILIVRLKQRDFTTFYSWYSRMVGMTFFMVYGNNLIFGLVYCKKE